MEIYGVRSVMKLLLFVQIVSWEKMKMMTQMKKGR